MAIKQKGPGQSTLTLRTAIDESQNPDDFIRKLWKAEQYAIFGDYEETGGPANTFVVKSRNRISGSKRRNSKLDELISLYLQKHPRASARDVAKHIESLKGEGLIEDILKNDAGQIESIGWKGSTGGLRTITYHSLAAKISLLRPKKSPSA